MRRPAVLLAAAALACGGHGGPQAPEPQSMTAAIDQFMAAVNANDVPRMSTTWGNEDGPASRWRDQTTVKQRLGAVQVYMRHDGYRIVEGPLTDTLGDNYRRFRVEIRRQGCAVVQPFDVVHTHQGGWLVYDVHIESAPNPRTPCTPAAGTRP